MSRKTMDHELYLLLKRSTKAVSRFSAIPTRILMTCLKAEKAILKCLLFQILRAGTELRSTVIKTLWNRCSEAKRPREHQSTPITKPWPVNWSLRGVPGGNNSQRTVSSIRSTGEIEYGIGFLSYAQNQLQRIICKCKALQWWKCQKKTSGTNLTTLSLNDNSWRCYQSTQQESK